MSSRTPCSDCAFKPGAGAYKEPYNRLKGIICSLGGIPFYCHDKIDWRKQH